jgi:hypothetical protein
VTVFVKNFDNKHYLDRVLVENVGNIECDIENLYITILNNDFKCSDSLAQIDNNCFKLYKPTVYVYKRECSPRRVNQGFSSEITFQKGCYFLSNTLDISYNLTYSNKYENETIVERPKLLLD